MLILWSAKRFSKLMESLFTWNLLNYYVHLDQSWQKCSKWQKNEPYWIYLDTFFRDERQWHACHTSSILGFITELLLSARARGGDESVFEGHISTVKVTMKKYENNLVKIREINFFKSVFWSTLVQMMPMIGRCTLLIFSVRGQRSGLQWEDIELTLWTR